MRIYLDASSLVKLYDPTEAGLAALTARLATAERIVLSDLAQVEFASAFQRKARRGDMAPELAMGIAAFDWVPLLPATLQLAAQLLEQHSALALRSLDAIQLACALAPAAAIDLFFTHDQRLRAAAQASGLAVQ